MIREESQAIKNNKTSDIYDNANQTKIKEDHYNENSQNYLVKSEDNSNQYDIENYPYKYKDYNEVKIEYDSYEDEQKHYYKQNEMHKEKTYDLNETIDFICKNDYSSIEIQRIKIIKIHHYAIIHSIDHNKSIKIVKTIIDNLLKQKNIIIVFSINSCISHKISSISKLEQWNKIEETNELKCININKIKENTILVDTDIEIQGIQFKKKETIRCEYYLSNEDHIIPNNKILQEDTLRELIQYRSTYIICGNNVTNKTILVYPCEIDHNLIYIIRISQITDILQQILIQLINKYNELYKNTQIIVLFNSNTTPSNSLIKSMICKGFKIISNQEKNREIEIKYLYSKTIINYKANTKIILPNKAIMHTNIRFRSQESEETIENTYQNTKITIYIKDKNKFKRQRKIKQNQIIRSIVGVQ